MMHTHLGKGVFCIIVLRLLSKVTSNKVIYLEHISHNWKSSFQLPFCPLCSNSFWKLPLTQRMLHRSCTTLLVTVIPVASPRMNAKLRITRTITMQLQLLIIKLLQTIHRKSYPTVLWKFFLAINPCSLV